MEEKYFPNCTKNKIIEKNILLIKKKKKSSQKMALLNFDFQNDENLRSMCVFTIRVKIFH